MKIILSAGTCAGGSSSRNALPDLAITARLTRYATFCPETNRLCAVRTESQVASRVTSITECGAVRQPRRARRRLSRCGNVEFALAIKLLAPGESASQAARYERPATGLAIATAARDAMPK